MREEKNGNANLKRIKEKNKSNNCLQSQMKLTPLQQSNNYNTVSPWMLITLSKRIKFLLYFSFRFVYVCLFEWRKSHLKSKKLLGVWQQKKCEISGKIKEKLRNYWFTKAELLILTLKINFVIRELFSAQS